MPCFPKSRTRMRAKAVSPAELVSITRKIHINQVRRFAGASRDRALANVPIELTRAVVSTNIEDGYFAALISVILISNDKVFPASG
jgi:hypothetical protein